MAANVAEHGTGGLNIDGCRIGTETTTTHSRGNTTAFAKRPGEKLAEDGGRTTPQNRGEFIGVEHAGRWPANVVLDEEAGAMLDAQSGERKSGTAVGGLNRRSNKLGANCYGHYVGGRTEGDVCYGDTGGASRFYYCAKASRAEREAGLEGMPKKQCGTIASDDSRVGRVRSDGAVQHTTGRPMAANVHPCVKPLSLMRWLCRLVTPPGGLILDPFAGSGTTGCAAVLEGFRFVGIEQDAEYCEIAKRRIAA